MKLYCIPGMGTDQRIYQRLSPLLDVKDIVYLDYIEPLRIDEPISEYAKRLCQPILAETRPPLLMGMSLGGFLATEISKFVALRKLFLISTIKTAAGAPWYFRPLQIVPLHRLVPSALTRISMGKLSYYFGVISKDGRDLLDQMIRDRSAEHLAWGRNTAVNWKNFEPAKNCVHIHGTKDHIFPYTKANPTYTIQGGTHCMIFDNAAEIAAIVNKELALL
ncbi:MAG: alpha/beta hydrolase [Saprospiraceae bacterium]|nr:alpha/beta hydrolase [Saprospiraceae bacterium]